MIKPSPRWASRSSLKVAGDRFSILARRRQIIRPSITRALTVRWAVHRSILICFDLRSDAPGEISAVTPTSRRSMIISLSDPQRGRREDVEPTVSWRTERMNHPLPMMTLWSKLRRRAVYFTWILRRRFKRISGIYGRDWEEMFCCWDVGGYHHVHVDEVKRNVLIPVLPSRYRFCEFLTWINGYYVLLFMYFQVYTTLPVWMLCYICVWSYSSLFPFMDFHF